MPPCHVLLQRVRADARAICACAVSVSGSQGIPEPNVTVKDGDVEKGAKIFKTKCAQCHNADQVRAAPMQGVIAPLARMDTRPPPPPRSRGSSTGACMNALGAPGS